MKVYDMRYLRIRELVRKEFIQLFRDKKNRPLLLIAPLIQLILFGYVVSTDIRVVRIAVIDQSHTLESRRLVDAFTGNKTFRIIQQADHPRDLDQLLLQRKVDLGIRIPPEYSRDIRKGHTATVQILADGSVSNMAAVRISYAVTVIENLNRRLLREIYGRKLQYGEIEGRIRTWYNPNLDSQYFYVPGIVAFIIMILTLLLTSMAIIREKETGTMEQLIVTPLKASELILGKTIPFILIAQTQMIMVSLFAKFWFGIPFVGNAFLLFTATGLYLLSTLGIAFHFHGLANPAAGHDDHLLLSPAVFYAQRVCFPHCQHAQDRAMPDISKPNALHAFDHSRHLFKRNRLYRALASISGAGASGRCCFCGGGTAIQKTP